MIINQYTEAFLKRSRGCVRVASFVSNLRFDDLINQELPELEKVEIEYEKKLHEGDGFILWNYSINRKLRDGEIKGSFLALQTGYFVFLITGQSPSYLRKVIKYITKAMYPEIMVAYITAEEIYEILQNLSKTRKTELSYSKYVAKKMFGDPFTSLGYTRAPYTEAFKQVRNAQPRLWIDSIRIDSEDSYKIDFRLSREGLLTFYKGNFAEYYEHVLVPIQEDCGRRLRIFEKRGRRQTTEKQLRPLMIRYDSKVFEDSFIRKQLINVIAKYDFCNFSVIHNGNPHTYLNIVDRIDNSTFSLRTYRSNSLIIAPQIKATKAALMRFSKHLMDRFLEGKISDFKV